MRLQHPLAIDRSSNELVQLLVLQRQGLEQSPDPGKGDIGLAGGMQ